MVLVYDVARIAVHVHAEMLLHIVARAGGSRCHVKTVVCLLAESIDFLIVDTSLSTVVKHIHPKTRVTSGVWILGVISGVGCIRDRIAVFHREGIHKILGRIHSAAAVECRREVGGLQVVAVTLRGAPEHFIRTCTVDEIIHRGIAIPVATCRGQFTKVAIVGYHLGGGISCLFPCHARCAERRAGCHKGSL